MTCYKLHLIIFNIKHVLIMLVFHSLHPFSISKESNFCSFATTDYVIFKYKSGRFVCAVAK